MSTWAQVGAVYGVAWQRTTARVYAAAFHKRYSGFSPSGPVPFISLISMAR
ncbi:MAG: hypothetical protein R2932_55425 [Caldilineaceae bacterium]